LSDVIILYLQNKMRSLAIITVAAVCLTAVHSAAVEDQNAVMVEEQTHAIDSSPELKRMIRKTNKVMRGKEKDKFHEKNYSKMSRLVL